jgi:transposase
VRNIRVWRAPFGVERTVIEGVEFCEDEELLVAHVRPRKGARGRCGRCGRKAPWYDRGEGRRRWRALDLGTIRAELEADAPRVNCRQHGPTVIQVPWARHGAGHTHGFDETVAWLAVRCSKTAVCELMRIAWRTVGAIVARVWADGERLHDRFAGLRRIGVDEVAYKTGHRYLTVVVDHDTGRLVWAAPGRDKATLRRFFDALGEHRSAQVTHVSADAADWIADVVAERCPNAIRCADPFHVVSWATKALDEERRQAWNQARGALDRRRAGRATGDAKALKNARYALWKNLEVRHEAPLHPGGDERTPPPVCRSRPVEAEGSLTVETHGRVGAALTTTGRAGTARRCGSGEQDETPYERNQCVTPPPAA